MSIRSRGALKVWGSRNVRTMGDHGYLAYMTIMVALVIVIPVARAVWISATGANGVAMFASAAAPQMTMLIVTALWAAGLMMGRDRGPAHRPPFVTHAFATSDLPRFDAFSGPLLRAGTFVTAVTTIAAGLVGASLMSHGLADLLGAATFALAGLLVGVIATAAWLGGQAFPRAASPAALGLIALGAATAAFPFVQPFVPWGWVAMTYPPNGSSRAVAALLVMTAAAIAALPVLMNRLSITQLAQQAARWDSIVAHAAGMDSNAAAAVYQARPQLGRSIRAVRPRKRLWQTFVLRDAAGAARTPGRLIMAILAIAGAGALMTLALAPNTPGWLLGAAAGVVLFAGLGPITDSIRHAASVASDLPLYGISDERLLTNHTLFPLVVTVIVLLAATLACAVSIGIPMSGPILSSLALGILALGTRISNALKGPLPPVLLSPVPTPMGDLSAAIRVAWAMDALVLTTLAGASVAIAFHAPALLVVVSVALVTISIHRWRHRR
ncbi:hypothetical protein ACWPKO_23700 (plasmid) [Coraliomargarita sp. W4R53]